MNHHNFEKCCIIYKTNFKNDQFYHLHQSLRLFEWTCQYVYLVPFNLRKILINVSTIIVLKERPNKVGQQAYTLNQKGKQILICFLPVFPFLSY